MTPAPEPAQPLPPTPAPFEPEFLADLPYDPSVLLFDRLLEVDPERSLVRARMATSADLPLISAQRGDPTMHPPHVAGGLMVHATGMLGFVHAYYVLGLRFREGWIGYGTHIHRAVFRRLAVPGTPLEATCRATRLRLGSERHFIRYELQFRDGAGRYYDGDQSAMWLRVGEGVAPPVG